MGSFLDKPKVEHHCEEVKGNGLDAGLAAMQVRRRPGSRPSLSSSCRAPTGARGPAIGDSLAAGPVPAPSSRAS